MRPISELLAEEPIALTSAITVTGNLLVIANIVQVDSNNTVAAINIAVGAWIGVLRWIVVPKRTADKQATKASAAGREYGYGAALDDLNNLKKATSRAAKSSGARKTPSTTKKK